MAISSTERYVYVCETTVKISRKPTASPPPLKSLLEEVKCLFNENRHLYLLVDSNGQKRFRLRDIKADGDKFVLLVGMSDENIPDGVNENRQTGALRELPRKQDEAPALSAHVLFDCSGGGEAAPTLIERVSGLSRTDIVRFIKRILKKMHEQSEGEGAGYPILEVDGHPSKTIQNALAKGGKLNGLIFVKREPKTDGIGEEGYFEEKESKIEIKFKKLSGGNAWEVFCNRIQRPEIENSEIKVRIEDTNGRKKTASIHPDDSDGHFFIAQELLSDFSGSLPSCHEAINEEILGKMFSVVEGLENNDDD